MSLIRILCQAVGLAVLTAVAASSGAVTIVECVDNSGQSTFQSYCPPGTTKKGEKKLQGDLKSQKTDVNLIATKHPVTLYAAPNCQACDLVRMQLNNRGVPFTEKDVSTDIEIQNELRSLTGGTGALSVPVVQLDEDILTGYNQQALDASLDRAGYPAADAAQPTPATPSPTGATGPETGPATQKAKQPGSANASEKKTTEPTPEAESSPTKIEYYY